MRQRFARLLYRIADRINPPQLRFTTKTGQPYSEITLGTVRRIKIEINSDTDALERVVSAQLGKGIVGRSFKPGDGDPFRY